MTSATTNTVPENQRGDPWFDDGNIVLLSEDSSVAFRVHRDFLSRHSEVFKSMFELPQPPPDDIESLEGCQVVRMFDQPVELSNLIKALYDGTGPSSNERTLEQFLYTAGILRLSTKYFIPRLRNEAIRQLVHTWSNTLRGHDEMIELALKSPLVDDKSYPYVHPLHVLNLARENHVQIIIPSVLYFLSLYPLADLLKADHPKLKLDHPSAPSCQISPEDLQGYTLMFQHRIQLILDFVRRTCGERAAAPGCLKDGLCTKVFIRTSSRLSRTWKARTGPLHFMVQVQDEILENPDVCGPCRRGFRQDVTALRENTWKSLPVIVGLPSWAELEAIDLTRTSKNQ
ncbi:hypothetical protein QCA50_006664 [Cerrena zonata]|uniref:BTB domain-containing protein n=1 Tax=Cerrena zonata TaxID=2478898 RepID=A0AAW0GFR8_9APHY